MSLCQRENRALFGRKFSNKSFGRYEGVYLGETTWFYGQQHSETH